MRNLLLILWSILLTQVAAAQSPKTRPTPKTSKPVVEAPLRVSLKQGDLVTDFIKSASLARDDAALTLKEGGDPTTVRYVRIPDWVEPRNGHARVALIANSTINRTPNLIAPDVIADGKLARIDIAKYVSSQEQLADVIQRYEKLARFDSHFNRPIHDLSSPPEKTAPPLREGMNAEVNVNGGWQRGKFVREDGPSVLVAVAGTTWRVPRASYRSLQPEPRSEPPRASGGKFTAERYLGTVGQELFELTQSNVPIMDLDEWVAFTFSTVNGGQYYELAGVEESLANTVARFAGADAATKVLRRAAALREAEKIQRDEGGKRSIYQIAAELDPELGTSRAVMNESVVTSRPRMFLFVNGSAIPPTNGIQIVAVTYDIGEATFDPDFDATRNTEFHEKYDGGEAILRMPNGMLLYLVFDANDKIIPSVPDPVTHNYEARKVRGNVSSARVFSGAACALCHEATPRNWGWQPVVNDVYDDLRGVTLLLGSRKNKSLNDEKLRELQRLASAYGADPYQLNRMLDGARVAYQEDVHRLTGIDNSRDVVRGIADSYWGYFYDAVTPEVAALQLGQVLDQKSAQAFLIREVEPEKQVDLLDTLLEDRVVARLKEARPITPVQWRTVFPFVAERLLVSQNLKHKPEPPRPESEIEP